MRRLPLLLLLTACVAPEKEATTTQVVDPSVESLPEVSFVPSVWETTGSELRPNILVGEGFEDRDVEVTFRYTGPGSVSCEGGAVSSTDPGFLTLEMPFVAQADGVQGEGRIDVIYQSQTLGEQVVGSLPVVHTLRIVDSIEFQREDSLASGNGTECSYVVVVNLVAPQGPHAQGIRAARKLDFQASVEAQAMYAPDVEVFANPDYRRFPSLPRHIALDGDRFVQVIAVENTGVAPMRRPFVKLQATVGGDRKVEYLPLKF